MRVRRRREVDRGRISAAVVMQEGHVEGAALGILLYAGPGTADPVALRISRQSAARV